MGQQMAQAYGAALAAAEGRQVRRHAIIEQNLAALNQQTDSQSSQWLGQRSDEKSEF